MDMNDPAPSAVGAPSAARQRLLDAATRVFYARGIHGVGIDEVIADAGVTRATMYRHFPGKEDLVVAYLEHEDLVIRSLFRQAQASGGTPAELLNAVVSAIVMDVQDRHTRGCPFINAAAEFPDESSRVREVISEHRQWFRQTLAEVVDAAGLTHAAARADQLVLLRDAALVGGYLDDPEQTTAAFAAAARLVLAP